MNEEKVKLIVRNLELLVDALKVEIYSNTNTTKYDDIQPKYLDYDEIFEE